MTWIIRFLLTGAALLLWAQVLPGVTVDGYATALIAIVVMALVNLFVKPVLVLLTLPLTLLTLGLFLIVLNVFLIWIAAWLTPGFHVEGFWMTLLFGVLMGVTNTVIDKVLSSA